MATMHATFEGGRATTAPTIGSMETQGEVQKNANLGARMAAWHDEPPRLTTIITNNTTRLPGSKNECASCAKVARWCDEEEEADHEPCLVCAGLWSGRKKVNFDGVVKYHYVPAYSTYYGAHPNTFHFGPDGTMIKIKTDDCALAIYSSTRSRFCGDDSPVRVHRNIDIYR